MKYYFLLTLIISGVFSGNAQPRRGEDILIKKMQSLTNALLRKDSVALSTILRDDVSYGHSNGLVQTKGQIIRSVISGEQDYKAIDASDVTIRLYESTGIITTQTHVSMIYLGKPLELKMKILFVWIGKKGEWQLAARQSVSVANP